ncbi:MAG: hypothetical protein ACK4ZW_08605 [Blastomonas sp.]
MSLPDSTAAAALDAAVIKPVWFAYLDIDGDPVRCNTSGADITVTGTGDPDLDDMTFIGISGDLVDVSPVSVREGGSESVTAELSGIASLDVETLTQLGDPANWQGRPARLWRTIRNAANVQQGGFQAYYTGYMTALDHLGDESGQTIRVTIETYLVAFSAASNRTYLDQERYDSGDLSARAAISIANGISQNPGATVGMGSVGGFGGFSGSFGEGGQQQR